MWVGGNMETLLTLFQPNSGLLLGSLLLQITVLAAIALAAAYWLRRSPVSQYGAVYSAMIALPIVLIVSIFLQWKQVSVVSIALGENPINGVESSPSFIFERLPVLVNLNDLLFELSLPNAAATPDTLAQTNTYSSSLTAIPIAGWLVLAWLAGAAVLFIGLIRSQIKLNRLIDRAAPLSRQHQSLIEDALKNLKVSRCKVEFRTSAEVATPVLVGIRVPTVCLPTEITQRLTSQQLRAVLLHEFAHLQRHDLAANYLQKIIRALFWFHPLVHLMDKIIDRSREEICDNYVLAKIDAVSYGEVLLKVGVVNRNSSARASSLQGLALGIHSQHWKLEDRIKGLIDTDRETKMALSKNLSSLIQGCMLTLALLISACQVGQPTLAVASPINSSDNTKATPADSTNMAEAEFISVQSPARDENRDPPQARRTQTLSEEVLDAVSQIQALLSNESDEENINPENLLQAKALLDQLTIDKFDSLNDFEKATSLNFLTNYYLAQEDYPNTIDTFKRILEIDNLRADIRLKALRALGQLTAALKQWQNSIDFYDIYRGLAIAEDPLVLRGLSYSNYQLDEFASAIRHWESYMEVNTAEGVELKRDDFAYLKGMYYSVEDLDKALELTKQMILKFDDTRDWNNLRSIYAMLDAQDQVDQTEQELLGVLENSATNVSIGSATYQHSDGDYLPLIAVAPQYPTQAANNGIEGWVLVSFTVIEDGTIDPQSLAVMDAEPAETFNRTSMRAAEKFEFQPRVVNGQPVPVEGVQYLFRFQLEGEV
jgi:TonB family protein